MNSIRFDQIAKRFADRRVSRREALGRVGVRLAAGAVASAGLGRAAIAQDATPPASPVAGDTTKIPYLFVQSFQGGSIAPKAGANGAFTLTLEHGLGQTLYFSDRPERIVGTAPTDRFLAGLGFAPDNPPNAALVIDEGGGAVNIAVVELTNPVFAAAGPSLTYDVIPLADAERTEELGFQEAPGDLSAIPATFGTAHLFIDDCQAGAVACYANSGIGARLVGGFSGLDMCWNWDRWCCLPCESGEASHLRGRCNTTFPNDCFGNCAAEQVTDCWI